MTRLDFSQPPFDILTPVERQSLKKHSQVRYLAKDQRLSDEDFTYFYVVLKGRVQQLLAADHVGEFSASNFSNDWFDARRAVLDSDLVKVYNALSASDESDNGSINQRYDSEKQSSHDSLTSTASNGQYQYMALEDSLLLQIEGAAIDRLSAQNHHIRQLLSGELIEKMQALRHRRQLPTVQADNRGSNRHFGSTELSQSSNANIANSQVETQQLMLQPVTTIPLLPVHIIDDSASLVQAATTMTKAGLKHVLVRRAPSVERHPTKSQDNTLGILTDADICHAVSDGVDMATTPCQAYANFRLRTIHHHQDISEALLAMIRYRIHRLPVLNEALEVIGILGQSDLLAFLNQHSQLITLQIEQAKDQEMLHLAVEQIGQYIRAQQQNGIKIGVISRIVQTLNAQVFTKLWRLIVPEMVFENTCVIVMGSEGRGEQIMRTDQDNALIIRNGFSHPELEKFADKFNQSLAKMGYPLCDGGIMMNNALWRQPLSRFKSQVNQWFNGSDPNYPIWLSALLDAAYVCGDERLFASLRTHLKIAHKNADPMFVRNFARAALQFGDVNQWWQKFVPLIGKPVTQDIDLKKAGIFPLVHGIRAMALEHDIFEVTSSKARLTALAKVGIMTDKRADTLNEALEFFMGLRLAVTLTTEDRFARQVDPTTLSALERDLLKECLNVVKSFKNELRHHYQLEVI